MQQLQQTRWSGKRTGPSVCQGDKLSHQNDPAHVESCSTNGRHASDSKQAMAAAHHMGDAGPVHVSPEGREELSCASSIPCLRRRHGEADIPRKVDSAYWSRCRPGCGDPLLPRLQNKLRHHPTHCLQSQSTPRDSRPQLHGLPLNGSDITGGHSSKSRGVQYMPFRTANFAIPRRAETARIRKAGGDHSVATSVSCSRPRLFFTPPSCCQG